VIPQDPFLFSGTIRSNLDPRGDVSDDALVDALRQCGFADTLSLNTNGTPPAATAPLEAQLLAGTKSEDSSINAQLRMLLDMEISSGGERLSQGQRQLLCLGKALAVKNAKVFLLDEATAAVDPVSEAALHRALGAHCQKTSATLLVVCHKIDSVKGLCNKVRAKIILFLFFCEQ
jgi:ABC-type multidrug transport system fused ATPase/permease subunit